MQARYFILLLLVALLLLIDKQVLAARLDGLEIRNASDKVQVILEMDKEQIYQVEHLKNSGYSIFLPRAVLPQSFQGAGIPPVTDTEASTTANIQEESGGIRILLESQKPEKLPYEVIFKSSVSAKTSQTKVPSSVTPVKPVKSNNLKVVKKLSSQPAGKTSTQQKPKTGQKTSNTKVSSEPLNKKALSGKKQDIREVKAKEPDTKVATETSEEEEGVNFLQQAAAGGGSMEESQNHKAADEVSPAGMLSSPFLSANNHKSSEKEIPDRLEQYAGADKSSFSLVIFKWLSVTVAIMGGLILLIVGLVVWTKRKTTKHNRSYLSENLPSSSADYFEEFLEPPALSPSTRQETFKESLTVEPEPLKPDLRTKKRQFTSILDSSSELKKEKIESPLPQREPVNLPQREEVEYKRRNNDKVFQQHPPMFEDLMVQPAKSFSDAVKSTIGSKSTPYMSPPFKIAPKTVNTQGGPKPKFRPKAK